MEKSVRCPYCSWKYLSIDGSYVGLTAHIRRDHDSPSIEAATEEARSVVMAALANAPAPTASDTAAELAALRDENARLREACEKALHFHNRYCDRVGVADSSWAVAVHDALRAALEAK